MQSTLYSPNIGQESVLVSLPRQTDDTDQRPGRQMTLARDQSDRRHWTKTIQTDRQTDDTRDKTDRRHRPETRQVDDTGQRQRQTENIGQILVQMYCMYDIKTRNNSKDQEKVSLGEPKT